MKNWLAREYLGQSAIGFFLVLWVKLVVSVVNKVESQYTALAFGILCVLNILFAQDLQNLKHLVISVCAGAFVDGR